MELGGGNSMRLKEISVSIEGEQQIINKDYLSCLEVGKSEKDIQYNV